MLCFAFDSTLRADALYDSSSKRCFAWAHCVWCIVYQWLNTLLLTTLYSLGVCVIFTPAITQLAMMRLDKPLLCQVVFKYYDGPGRSVLVVLLPIGWHLICMIRQLTSVCFLFTWPCDGVAVYGISLLCWVVYWLSGCLVCFPPRRCNDIGRAFGQGLPKYVALPIWAREITAMWANRYTKHTTSPYKLHDSIFRRAYLSRFWWVGSLDVTRHCRLKVQRLHYEA